MMRLGPRLLLSTVEIAVLPARSGSFKIREFYLQSSKRAPGINLIGPSVRPMWIIRLSLRGSSLQSNIFVSSFDWCDLPHILCYTILTWHRVLFSILSRVEGCNDLLFGCGFWQSFQKQTISNHIRLLVHLSLIFYRNTLAMTQWNPVPSLATPIQSIPSKTSGHHMRWHPPHTFSSEPREDHQRNLPIVLSFFCMP